MYGIAAPFIGVLITMMNGVNSRLSSVVGALTAALTIHVTGIVIIHGVLAARTVYGRAAGKPLGKASRLPWYLYLGGVVGVGTVFSCNYAYTVLDASLAVALGLIGQTVFSIIADATGFLGRERRPVSARRLPGMALAVIGAVVIARNWRSDGAAMLIALGSGLCTGLNALLNAEHGRRNGTLRSARWNYISGLSVTLVIVAATRPDWRSAAASVADAGPFLAAGGASLGVMVVMSMNLVFARLPAFRATLLLFSGQALSGVVMDAAVSGAFDPRKLVGTVVVVAGLALDSAIGTAKDAGKAVTAPAKP